MWRCRRGERRRGKAGGERDLKTQGSSAVEVLAAPHTGDGWRFREADDRWKEGAEHSWRNGHDAGTLLARWPTVLKVPVVAPAAACCRRMKRDEEERKRQEEERRRKQEWEEQVRACVGAGPHFVTEPASNVLQNECSRSASLGCVCGECGANLRAHLVRTKVNVPVVMK